MGANLLKAGFELTVWNRTASRAEALVAQGAKRAANPGEVAAASDVLFHYHCQRSSCARIRSLGENGVFPSLRKGSLLIDSSTVSPTLARRIAEATAREGIEFLDAPVTGGTWGAEKGELVFMVGGPEETLKRAEPVLGAMGKKWFLLGPNGAGQTVKLAMNMLLALQVDAFAESLALVTRAGIPGERLFEVMQSSMARAGVLDVKGPMMLKGDYTPSFPLRLMHKDLGLALELANQLGVPLPAAAAARESYSAVKGAATSDVDFSAIATFWAKR